MQIILSNSQAELLKRCRRDEGANRFFHFELHAIKLAYES
jgi:hypothetical protein